MDAGDIEDEGEACRIDWDPSRPPPSVVERYYEQFYVTDFRGKEGCDYYVHLHANRLCVIGLAPSHPIVRNNLAVREAAVVNVASESVVCELVCDNGETYPVHAVVPGELVDKNDGLRKNPQLVTLKPSTDGYVAIVHPKQADFRREAASFLSPTDYARQCQERQAGAS